MLRHLLQTTRYDRVGIERDEGHRMKDKRLNTFVYEFFLVVAI